ncbi:MAG: hypothetical protein QOJ70_2823 [Acidobacteriota bacterium]|nr:hypothetical protein [Acidobacteriota bacterium]
MNHVTPFPRRRNVRAFVSAIISYMMLAGQIAPLALGANALTARTTRGSNTPAVTTTTTRAAMPAPAPLFATGPVITTTKIDSWDDTLTPDGKAEPGQVVTYTVNIQNTGDAPATGVTFNDSVDTNSTLIAGSVNTQPVASNDTFNVVGNVRIAPNAAQGLLANDRNPDAGNNTGLTASGPTTGPTNGQATVSADGSFTYNPNPGFTGTDSFTYTIKNNGQDGIAGNADDKSDTATATLEVGLATHDKLIWFIDASKPPGGDGRLTNPYNCLVGAGCFFPAAADDPGDVIFLAAGAYTGGVTLLNNEKFIGQGATDTLSNISGIVPEAYSDALPSTGGASPTITTSAATTNAFTIAQGNLLRGFTVGNTTGAKISGTGFLTLTVGNNTSPDVTLNGTGQALNLTNGTFAVTSAFNGVATTSSSTQGIFLSQVAGTVAFGSTTVSGSTSEGILTQSSTANINFGNTSVTGGTNAISLSSNSAGTRTFGTIGVTTPSAVGFLHGTGGGLVTAGATTITNPTGTGIDIQNSTTQVTFGATTVNKGSTAGTGVNLATNSGGTTFGSLAITTSNGAGLTTNSAGTVTVSAAAGSSISATGVGVTVAPAISAVSTTFNAAFTSLASTNSGGAGTGLTLTGDGGTLTSTTTNIQNPGGIGINVGTSGAASTFNFGNTTVNGSGSTGVSLTSNTGALTFADLDISPDAAQRALLATNNAGTITTTSGDITATGNVSLEITGASAAARTPLAMVLNNLDSTTSTGIGVNLNFVSGNFTVNDPGVSTNISASTGIGIQVQNSGAGTINFGNTTVANTVSTGIVLGTAANGNTGNITFAALNISPVAGQRALLATQNTGTITSTSGAIATTNNTAVEVQGTSNASRTPLNMQLTSVNVVGGSLAPDGIFLNNTSASGSPGGFNVLGNGGSCTQATPTCTGGRIQLTSGADGSTGGTGVRMVNANSVSLTLMRLNDNPNFSVYGNNVNGFSLTNSFIHGINGTNAAVGTEEGSVSFDNLLGSATISGCDIDGGKNDNIRVVNTSGTLNRLTVSNTIIRFLDATVGNDALHFEGFNAGTVMNLTVTGCTFKGARGDMIDALVQPGVTMDTVIRLNSFTNEQTNVVSGNTAIIVQGPGTMTYDVSCNKVQQVNAAGTTGTAQGNGINVAKSTAGGNFSGTIFNNTVGKPGVQSSGAGLSGEGIQILANGVGTHTSLIKNNVINNYGESGIKVLGNNGSSTANITIIGNTTSQPHPTFGFAGLFVDWGAFASDTNTLNLKVGGAGGEANNFTNGTAFDPGDISVNKGAAAPNTHINLTQPPSGSATAAQVLVDNNPGATTNNSGTITLVGTVPTLPAAIDQTCTPPAGPVSFGGGTASAQTVSERPASQPTSGVTSRPFVSLPRTVAVAPKTVLVAPRTSAPIVVRRTTEPASSTTQGTAATVKPASTVTPKPRRDAVIINGAGGNVSVNIGTLNAGDSVTITFQVTIDNPFSGALPQISNQGTVTTTNAGTVLTDDPSVAGTANPTVTPVNTINIRANDAKVAEPTTGSTPMLFTVTLSGPAPVSGLSLTYATADQPAGAGHAVGGAACDGTADYVNVPNTILNFASGEQLKTISVNVCADSTPSEPDETFLLNLSLPSTGTLIDAQAVGTITAANPAGTFIVSELRTTGPGGAGDDFVELYNNTNSPLTVASSDASAGFGVFKMSTDCNAVPVLIGTIPNGTIIPARGHFLFVGSQYSLGSYATGDVTMTSDIETDHNVAVFSTANVAALSTASRLDAVGFDGNTGGGVCDLLRESNTLPPIAAAPTAQHSFFRRECDFVGGVGCQAAGNPKDTGDNAADFFFADTQGTFISGVPQHLGAPGPENKTSPIRRDTSGIGLPLLDATQPLANSPNRGRDLTSNPPNSTFGTLTIRRRVTNSTGATVTKLRFRIIELTTFPSPGGGIADLRALTSTSTVISGIQDSATCASTGTPTTAPCQVTVQGTTLEQPPTQPNGGGYNSTMSLTLPGGGLANNASLDVQFLLGVQTTGTFRFYIIIEALP